MITRPYDRQSVSSIVMVDGFSSSEFVTIDSISFHEIVRVINGKFSIQLNLPTGETYISATDNDGTHTIKVYVITQLAETPTIIEINKDEDYIIVSGLAGQTINLEYNNRQYQGTIDKYGRATINYNYEKQATGTVRAINYLGNFSSPKYLILSSNQSGMLSTFVNSGLAGLHKDYTIDDLGFIRLQNDLIDSMTNLNKIDRAIKTEYANVNLKQRDYYYEDQISSLDIFGYQFSSTESYEMYNLTGMIGGSTLTLGNTGSDFVYYGFTTSISYPSKADFRLYYKLNNSYVEKLSIYLTNSGTWNSGSAPAKLTIYPKITRDYLLADVDITSLIQGVYLVSGSSSSFGLLVKIEHSSGSLNISNGGSTQPIVVIKQ